MKDRVTIVREVLASFKLDNLNVSKSTINKVLSAGKEKTKMPTRCKEVKK